MTEFIIGIVILGVIVTIGLISTRSNKQETITSGTQGGGYVEPTPQDDDLRDIKNHENIK